MNWVTNPYLGMAILNCATGAFSAIAGLINARGTPPGGAAGVLDTSNPWLYVLGGIGTIILGMGNFFQLPIATYGTILMIVASFYNAWFGAARGDWRFWTLNAYVIVLSGLVVGTFMDS